MFSLIMISSLACILIETNYYFHITFSQTIPCHASKDFLDHVNRHINHEGQFEVSLVQEIVPDKTYKILVVNEANRTYFTRPLWTELVERYEMDAGMRLRNLPRNYLWSNLFLIRDP